MAPDELLAVAIIALALTNVLDLVVRIRERRAAKMQPVVYEYTAQVTAQTDTANGPRLVMEDDPRRDDDADKPDREPITFWT